MDDPMNVLVFVLLVGSRLLVPLWIPRFPLPAIILALVLDGIDGGVFANNTTLPLDNYQSYDKALDIYYLTIAYLSTFRNWRNPIALQVAQFLIYYRLVGVLLFEFTGTRLLLFIFPNTFEYFFILYEVARLRWDMARVSRKVIYGAAAAIWIVIKLPQEYWIHIAQRDVTDTLAEYPALVPILAFLIALLVVVGYWLITRKLAPADHRPSFGVNSPVPGHGMKDAILRFRALPLRDQGLIEKVILILLLSLNFSQILPGTALTPLQLVIGIALVVVMNAVISELISRRGLVLINGLAHFAMMVAINMLLAIAFLILLPGQQSDIRISNMVFFFFLVSLLVTLFDRFRVIAMFRLAGETASVPS